MTVSGVHKMACGVRRYIAVTIQHNGLQRYERTAHESGNKGVPRGKLFGASAIEDVVYFTHVLTVYSILCGHNNSILFKPKCCKYSLSVAKDLYCNNKIKIGYL